MMIAQTRQMLSALPRVADTTQTGQLKIDPQLTHGPAEGYGGPNMSYVYNQTTKQTVRRGRECDVNDAIATE